MTKGKEKTMTWDHVHSEGTHSPMSRMKRWALVLGSVLLVMPPVCVAPAATAAPADPVPPSPARLAPPWSVTVPGRWQPAPGAPDPYVPAPVGGRDSTPREPSRTAPGRGAGSKAAARVIAAVNRSRTRAGCRPLRLRAALNRAAQAHSVDMARHHRLGHAGADGSTPVDRMRAAGYHPRAGGENVVAGTRTARAAVDAWMGSPPHRANILTCGYRDAGVGVAAGSGGPWWTLDLASGR